MPDCDKGWKSRGDIVTERHFLKKALAKSEELEKVKVNEVMANPLVTGKSDTEIEKTAKPMFEKKDQKTSSRGKRKAYPLNEADRSPLHACRIKKEDRGYCLGCLFQAVAPKLIPMIVRSKMSMMSSGFNHESRVAFHFGCPGYDPKTKATVTISTVSTIPSLLTSPVINGAAETGIAVLIIITRNRAEIAPEISFNLISSFSSQRPL